MKIHKMFCIEHTLYEKLRRENASALVNQLLIDHFKRNDISNLTIEQLERRSAALLKFREAEKELEDARSG